MRGSTRGRADPAVGSSPAISVSSRRSSCLPFDWARVAVLARALFLAMNSSRCRRLARMAAFERSSCSRFFALIFQKGVDLAGKHRQLAARQIERVAAGGAQKGPIVRDDQARLAKFAQEMLEQNLRAQVEESSSARRAAAGSARAAAGPPA